MRTFLGIVKPLAFPILALALALLPVFLPKLAHAATAGNDDFVQARPLDGSCALPGYPPDAAAAGRTLRLRLDFTVGADGRVKRAAIGQPSGMPAYDRAALDALERCLHVPAQLDGRPVEVSMSREIVHAPRVHTPHPSKAADDR